MPAPKTAPARAAALEKQAKALELRRAGLGFEEIGRRLGIGKSQAHRYVSRALEAAREANTASADQLRTEQLDRLSALLETVWLKARGGDMQKLDRALKIMERQDRLLGIEAPVRIETTGKAGGPIEVSSTQTIDPSKLSTATLQELLDARRGPSAN